MFRISDETTLIPWKLTLQNLEGKNKNSENYLLLILCKHCAEIMDKYLLHYFESTSRDLELCDECLENIEVGNDFGRQFSIENSKGEYILTLSQLNKEIQFVKICHSCFLKAKDRMINKIMDDFLFFVFFLED